MRVELGVTQEMEQYDTNFKVRQLLGDPKNMPQRTEERSFKREKSITQGVVRGMSKVK